jgi:hypothetical protein
VLLRKKSFSDETQFRYLFKKSTVIPHPNI